MRGQLIQSEVLIGLGQGSNVEREFSSNTRKGIFIGGSDSKHFKSCDAFIVRDQILFTD